MGIGSTFLKTSTVEIEQYRYEELIRAEQKAMQYRRELERTGDMDYLINIIEAIENKEEQGDNK